MRNLKRALSLTLASVMLLGMMVVGSSALSFNDADDISNVTAATVLEELGVMVGDGAGNFMPNQTVTRAQMAILICRILYGDKLNVKQFEGVTKYNDVGANDYYTGYINLATQLGIINGYGDGRFGPDDTVTTAQAALMLSRALGYFKANELEGQDWALASVAQATKINMFGNLKLATNELLSRDNVCEMVFNTMTAAVPVQYSERWGVYYTDSQSLMEGVNFNYSDTLAYQNFDLVYNEDKTDDFNRPSTEWGVGVIKKNGLDDKGNIDENGATIRLSFIKAVEEADLTYTKQVKISDIYKDLGLAETVKVENVTVYVDGVEDSSQPARAIRKNDTDNKYGGNGVLTQVFYFPGSRSNVDDKIVITEVKTYIGEINRTVAASGGKDAYVEVLTTAVGTAPDDAKSNEKFETTATFADEAKVLYTYSRDVKEIKSVELAESITGNVSQVVNKKNTDDENKSVTIDGTKYDASKTMADNLLGSISVDLDYTAYMDKYGYVIHVDEEEYKDYALVLAIKGAAGTNDDAIDNNQAKLVLTDGTVRVVSTDKNYKTGSNSIAVNDIVTYREKDNGVFTLKKVAASKYAFIENSGDDITSPNLASTGYPNDDQKAFWMKSERAEIVTGKASDHATNKADQMKVYGNSSSMIVVYNKDDDKWLGYTGIKNAPTVRPKDLDSNGTIEKEASELETVDAYWYCKSGSIVTAMFILPADYRLVEDDNNDLLFLAGESVSDIIHDTIGDYYTYNAVVKGEIQKVMVDADLVSQGSKAAYALNGLYQRWTTDSDGIITSLEEYQTSGTGKIAGMTVGSDRNTANYTVLAGVDNKGAALGSGTDTVITTAYNRNIWTVDDSCEFYAIDEDGNIENGTYGSVTKDSDDRLYFILDGGALKYVFVETVNGKNDAQTPSVTIAPAGAQSVAMGGTLKLTANVSGVTEGNLTYQWYKYSDGTLTLSNINTATILSGETGKTLTVTGETAGEKAFYYCVVTNSNDKVSGDSVKSGFAVSDQITTGAASSGVVGVRVTYKDSGNNVIGAGSIAVPVDIAGFGELTEEMLTLPDGYELNTTPFTAIEIDKATSSTLKQDITVKARTDMNKIEILDKNNAFLWVKSGTAPTKDNVGDGTTAQFKVSYPDGASITIKADDSRLTYAVLTAGDDTTNWTKDGHVKVTFTETNTVSCEDLAVKIYGEYATDVTEGNNITGVWTVTAPATTAAKTGKVTLTFTAVNDGATTETDVKAFIDKLQDDGTANGLTINSFTFKALTAAGSNSGKAVFTVDMDVTRTGAPGGASITIKLKASDS